MTERRTTPLPGVKCLSCGYQFDASTAAGQDDRAAVPKNGSVSLCIQCGAVAIFTRTVFGAYGLRLPTLAETADIDADPEIRRIRDAIVLMHLDPDVDKGK